MLTSTKAPRNTRATPYLCSNVQRPLAARWPQRVPFQCFHHSPSKRCTHRNEWKPRAGRNRTPRRKYTDQNEVHKKNITAHNQCFCAVLSTMRRKTSAPATQKSNTLNKSTENRNPPRPHTCLALPCGVVCATYVCRPPPTGNGTFRPVRVWGGGGWPTETSDVVCDAVAWYDILLVQFVRGVFFVCWFGHFSFCWWTPFQALPNERTNKQENTKYLRAC